MAKALPHLIYMNFGVIVLELKMHGRIQLLIKGLQSVRARLKGLGATTYELKATDKSVIESCVRGGEVRLTLQSVRTRLKRT